MGAGPIIFLVLVALAFTSLGIAAVWDNRKKRQFTWDTAARWLEEGRQVHFAPVMATYYGNQPNQIYKSAEGTFGALGIADQALVFVQRGPHVGQVSVIGAVLGVLKDEPQPPVPVQYGPSREQRLPFDLIRWIGVHDISVNDGENTLQKKALVVHYEENGSWYVAAWVTDWPRNAAIMLCQQTGLPEHSFHEDYGPAKATCMLQDVYGEWHPVAEVRARSDIPVTPFSAARSSEGNLYLAPDRLLFNFCHTVHLSQIRRVDVYERGGLLNDLNPFAEELLRVEYDLPDGDQRRVTGFLIRQADKWGKALAQRTQVPFEVHEGRKKKE